MNYKQFKNAAYLRKVGAELKEQCSYYEHILAETVDGYIFVDGVLTEFSSLEEVKDQIKQQGIQQDIQKEIYQDLYEEVSYNKIAQIINEHHQGVRVTDTLVESYIEMASSKLFTLDPVAHYISKSNKMDHLIEGRLDYKLNDGCSIVINEGTYERINNMFAKHPDVIKHMRMSTENFLDVINAIEE
jgi:hypothetical protein